MTEHPADAAQQELRITTDTSSASVIPAPFVIRPQVAGDIDDVVAFSLRAWKPVHESMAQVLGARINRLVYPDWAADQARAVDTACRDENAHVWVADIDTHPVGFVSVVFHDNPLSGEIDMVAVDPDHQGARDRRRAHRLRPRTHQRCRRPSCRSRHRWRPGPCCGTPHPRKGRVHGASAGPVLQGAAGGLGKLTCPSGQAANLERALTPKPSRTSTQ
jgi:Acetyltransferase (GNAT) family